MRLKSFEDELGEKTYTKSYSDKRKMRNMEFQIAAIQARLKYDENMKDKNVDDKNDNTENVISRNVADEQCKAAGPSSKRVKSPSQGGNSDNYNIHKK